MRIGVLSDIHANVLALEAVLRIFHNERVDQILQLGDVVGLGPDPAGAIDRLRDLSVPVHSVYGNHDRGALGLETKLPGERKPMAEEHHAYVRSMMNEDHLRWLRELPAVWEQTLDSVPYFASHYALEETGMFRAIERPLRKETVREWYGTHSAKVILYGHHHPRHILQDERLYINPGSVGCPHSDWGLARALILQMEKSQIRVRIVEATYDVRPVIHALRNSEDPIRDITLRIFFHSQ